MVKQWHSAMVPTSRAPARKAPKQSALEVSAEEQLAVRSVAVLPPRHWWVMRPTCLSACAIGFTRPVLLTAGEGKSLTHCEPSR